MVVIHTNGSYGKRGDEVAAVLLEAVHRCEAVLVRNMKGQGWRMTGGCGTNGNLELDAAQL